MHNEFIILYEFINKNRISYSIRLKDEHIKVDANLTSISRTRCVSGNRSQTLLFIFSLMMNEWHVRQSPIFMALLAATTCSLMLSGGPGG